MRLISLLLILVAAVHYGTAPIAATFSNPVAVNKALFYIAQGVKGCILWLVIAYLLKDKDKDKGKLIYPAFAVCSWGAIEDFQVASCRLAKGIESVTAPQLFSGLCDQVTGLPVYFIGMLIGLLVAAIVDFGSKNK